MADAFISYHHGDRRTAERVASHLSDAGISSWWDASLVAGDSFSDAIRSELKSAQVVVVLWSQSSWSSQWVQAEAQAGLEKGALVAARLDDVALEPPFNVIHTADLRDASGMMSLVSGVEQRLSRIGTLDKRAKQTGARIPQGRRALVAAIAAALMVGVVGFIAWRSTASDAPAEIAEIDAPGLNENYERSASFEVRFAQNSFWLNAAADEIARRFADQADNPPDSVVIHSTCRLQRDQKIEDDRAAAVFVAVRRGGIPAEVISSQPCDLMIAPAVPPGAVRVTSYWLRDNSEGSAVADAVCSALAGRADAQRSSYEGAVAINPQTGDRLQWRDGEWHQYPRVDSAEWQTWTECCLNQAAVDGYQEYISRYPHGALVSEACTRLEGIRNAP